jgi:glutathione S-transferase
VILIGQYDSPFVRRVAVTLRLYGLPYEHRKWSVWGDAEKIAELNPLRRVPTLVLDDGTVVGETFAIIELLDEVVGPDRALLARSGRERLEGLRLTALVSGLADKAVSLLYESLFRPAPSETWVSRCRRQIMDTLAVLEADRGARKTSHWLGERLTHPDVAFACAYRFIHEAHPGAFGLGALPSLAEAAGRCEALEAFRGAYQPITNNL